MSKGGEKVRFGGREGYPEKKKARVLEKGTRDKTEGA